MRRSSKGKCHLCGGVFGKTAMTRHLEKCRQGDAAGAGEPKGFHLLVEGDGQPEYWMHVEAPAAVKLKDLDKFLRDTWLECCGHMSAFRIEGQSYVYPSGSGLGKSMNAALEKVLAAGMSFEHEYDFGTTTALALRVVAERAGPGTGKAIRLLARNEIPPISCGQCGKNATQVCGICLGESEAGGWLCDACADGHRCGDEMLLPVVNSPRVGLCGYTGED